MTHKKYIGVIFFITIMLFHTGCKKYLDQRPQKTLIVPSTLTDLQALLDNSSVTNQQTSGMAELAADNYYITTEDWQSLPYIEQSLNYIWNDKDAIEINSWQQPYQHPIYYSNIVLDVLPKIEATEANKNKWNSIKGTALFYRAFSFFQLAQLYCRPYSSLAGTDPGIVLKLTSPIGEHYTRATVQQTYDQVINDLKTAADLLPVTTLKQTRPNKAAAYGALARTYLSMRDYVNAGYYADLSLQQNSSLMDFNSITAMPDFNTGNTEINYFNTPFFYDILYAPSAKIDSTLYQSYDNDDLRKTIFFSDNGDATYSFNGSYASDFGAGFIVFDGITTSEMYLIRAECFARAGNTSAAMADLNSLMVKRWNNVTWVPFTAADATDAKNKILAERRKELVYRGLRWSDIRRLNLEGANISLTRVIDGFTYTLPPNDLRCVLLIPKQEINLSGIQQNPR